MTQFRLPDLGEGLCEAEIVAWHVADGDHVVVDQPLVAVETEKAVVEIPSPRSGHVAKLLVRVGEHVQVGGALLEFAEGPEAAVGTVEGEPAKPAAPPAPHHAQMGSAGAVHATPVVRSRARELGVDLAQVTPTGPGGTATLADVEAATAASRAVKAADTENMAAKPLRGARRAMAIGMGRAWRDVVHASLYDDVDVDAWPPTEDVTARLIRAVIAGCRAQPLLNSSFDAATLSLRENPDIDLGLAIDSPEGLFVPVLRDVGRSSREDWRRSVDAMKRRVEQRNCAPADLRNPTITLSNFGTIAGGHAALIVMPPQVAIIGAGRITGSSVRNEDALARHRTLPISLTFDHRAVTGGEAARFLQALLADLSQPC
jgi:2-oxoisovalerate dehydrogenase E2 component (dihydrolipoyl transacylase)